MNNFSDTEIINQFGEKYKSLQKEISKVIVGQDSIVNQILICIFSRGHCLLEGVPGLAKTLMVNTIAKTLGLTYSRVQFTPDLMPSDIVGTEILDENRKFRFIKGPVFANIILADEINRTPPKTQAALLEAMQEKSVTIAGNSYLLEEPFFVLATQNPIEQEGTYPLPEAQLDRFMFNVKLDYPSFKEEVDIVKRTTTDLKQDLNIILTAEEIISYQHVLRKIPVPDNVYQYAVKLASSTRNTSENTNISAKKYIAWGAGPRASQYLIIGAKTHAATKGKYSPDIEDIKAIAPEILRHRIVRNYNAEAEGIGSDEIIRELLNN